MAKRYEWDDYPGAFIELPDEFLGRHVKLYRQAMDAAEEAELPMLLARFTTAIHLLDDWKLPGVPGQNPDNWDIDQTPIQLMARVNDVTLRTFNACFDVPKGSSEPSQPGPEEAAEKAIAAGGSEQTD